MTSIFGQPWEMHIRHRRKTNFAERILQKSQAKKPKQSYAADEEKYQMRCKELWFHMSE